MSKNKEEYPYCSRKIVFSETFEDYCANVSSHKDCDIWNDAKSKGFLNWIENTWLPKCEVFSVLSKNYVLMYYSFYQFLKSGVG